MRTYGKTDFEEADRLWRTGNFDPRWEHIRALAAERGFIYPPSGSAGDDPADPDPSQRSIIWVALLDRPRELGAIVMRCRSWHAVVEAVITMNDRVRMTVEELEADPDPTPEEATAAIAAILDGIRGQ